MTDIPVIEFVVGLMIFLRVTGALFTAPFFSNSSMPVLARLLLSLVLSYIIFLTADKDSFNVELTLGWLAINGMKEMIIGLIIGFTLQLAFHAISYAGMLIGFDMALSMANVFNPASEMNNSVIGQFIYTMALLIFLLINGHHYIISAAVFSFTVVPIGKFVITGDLLELLIKYSASVFVIAVKIAAPITVSFFLINVASGVIARVVPQMQVFFVVLPIKIGLGLFLLMAAVPVYIYAMKNILRGFEQNLFEIIKVMGI